MCALRQNNVWPQLHLDVKTFQKIALSTWIGGVILGGIGFVDGFVGPMIFAPQANHGPMLGIFITGPLGFFLGVIIGCVVGVVRTKTKKT